MNTDDILARARENLKNVEKAFNAELGRVGQEAANCFTRIDRGGSLQNVPATDREGAAKLAHAKGHVKLAEAEVERAQGRELIAKRHDQYAERMFRLRDQLRNV